MKLTILSGVLAIVVAPVFAAAAPKLYPISGDNVNCRSGPGTNYASKKVYPEGHMVSLACQTPGTAVYGNSIWDKTQDGCYVADYYVKTGVNGYVTGKCGGGGGGGGGANCAAPSVNQATLDFILGFEGWSATIYTDATGHPTVGYGHLCSDKRCSDVKYPIPLSKANGRALFASEIKTFEKCVKEMLNSKAVLNHNQYGALVSWSFNVGCGAARSSQLVKRLNAGQNVITVLSEELPKFSHGNHGEVIPGLLRRRKEEVALAKRGGSGPALPVKC